MRGFVDDDGACATNSGNASQRARDAARDRNLPIGLATPVGDNLHRVAHPGVTLGKFVSRGQQARVWQPECRAMDSGDGDHGDEPVGSADKGLINGVRSERPAPIACKQNLAGGRGLSIPAPVPCGKKSHRALVDQDPEWT